MSVIPDDTSGEQNLQNLCRDYSTSPWLLLKFTPQSGNTKNWFPRLFTLLKTHLVHSQLRQASPYILILQHSSILLLSIVQLTRPRPLGKHLTHWELLIGIAQNPGKVSSNRHHPLCLACQSGSLPLNKSLSLSVFTKVCKAHWGWSYGRNTAQNNHPNPSEAF